MKYAMRCVLGLVVSFASTWAQAADVLPGDFRAVTSGRGLVVSVSAPASTVGATILRQGGNAVDAAVATAFALAVTYPPAGNIGGGGFMMILPGPGQAPVCVDYRETAPAAAHQHMFDLGETHLSAKAVGVPGTVRGLALAHERYGKLPWRAVVMPAVKLARDGFSVNGALATSLNNILADKRSDPFAEMRRVFASPKGGRWHAGDHLVQAELAQTLERIAARGPDGFYAGTTANRLVAEMRAFKGLITLKDLTAYQAKWRTPIHTTYRDYDVYGPPPPSSGGITLALVLNVLENFDLRQNGRWSPRTVHLIIESMRRAYLDRARYLGDQDFVSIPHKLTTKQYAAQLAAQIDLAAATPSAALAPDIRLAPEETSTTHFSIVDRNGMAVANTYTLEQSYGSRIMVRGAGFLLNNEMGDFNWAPGHTDTVGHIGTPPNIIRPGKRMLSSQTPVLVLKEGQAYLVTGSPGGRTIINTVLNVVLNSLEFNMRPVDAIAAPRLHHQWLPDVVRFEGRGQPQYGSLIEHLQAMGHEFATRTGKQGDAHSIFRDSATGKFIGIADRRISGSAQ